MPKTYKTKVKVSHCMMIVQNLPKSSTTELLSWMSVADSVLDGFLSAQQPPECFLTSLVPRLPGLFNAREKRGVRSYWCA